MYLKTGTRTMLIFMESFGHLWALPRSKTRYSQGAGLFYLPQPRVQSRQLEAAFLFQVSRVWHGIRAPVFTQVWETAGETSGVWVCTMPSWATLPGPYWLCLHVAQKWLFPDLFVSVFVYGKYTTQIIWPQKTKGWHIPAGIVGQKTIFLLDVSFYTLFSSV